MSVFGIIELHDEITRSNGNYCSICFRSASERRLVEPESLNLFLINMSRRKYFRKKVMACYVCEALAASAVRFQKSVELASTVGVLYDDITETGHWQTVVKYLMDSQANKAPKVLAGSIVQRALAMDKTLRATSRFELNATDTLVVSSVKDPPKPSKPPPQPPQPPPPSRHPSDTVVVLDDDDTAQAPPHVRVINQETNEIVLHPVLKGTDGKLYVPSLKLQVLDNGLFQGVTDVQIQNCTTSPAVTNPQIHIDSSHHLNANVHTNNSQNQTFCHTHTQTYSNTKRDHNSQKRTNEKNDYYNFLLTQTQQKNSVGQNGVSNVDVIKMNDMNIILHADTVNKKRKVPDDPLRMDLPGSIQQDLHESAEETAEIKYEVIIEDDSANVDSLNNGMTESRAPVPRTDQTVDWEDKIPMDVISFMDATDPNPSERIMQPQAPAPAPAPTKHTTHTMHATHTMHTTNAAQTKHAVYPPAHTKRASHTPHATHAPNALGFISDVRSVPRDAPEQIECIDLC